VLNIPATGTALWSGQTVSGSDTLVRYTYGGDANLDGKLTIDDYGRIDFNFPLQTTGWSNGDFNYDGKLTIDDYGIIDFNYPLAQGHPFPAGATTATPALAGVTAVPEPAAVTLLGLGAAGLLARRRRRLGK